MGKYYYSAAGVLFHVLQLISHNLSWIMEFPQITYKINIYRIIQSTFKLNVSQENQGQGWNIVRV